VLAAQQYPELFAAFVGAGQMVDPRATDRLYYQDTLAWAERTGATEVARQLTRNGPPPYADPLKYEPVLGNEQEVYAYDDSGLAEGANGFSENLFHDEYSLMEQAHLFAGFLDTFVALYPQLQEIDFRTQVTRLEIPGLSGPGWARDPRTGRTRRRVVPAAAGADQEAGGLRTRRPSHPVPGARPLRTADVAGAARPGGHRMT
jgi:hypothetical protein